MENAENIGLYFLKIVATMMVIGIHYNNSDMGGGTRSQLKCVY